VFLLAVEFDFIFLRTGYVIM